MMWEALAFAALGLAAAYAAVRLLPTRLPARSLVLATGSGAALLGGLLAHTILGPGHVVLTLALSVTVAVALLSLLVRPADRRGPRASSPRPA
ncbi:hypothetical protein ACFXJ5_00260 [Streptomyces sp. NPDC059373]